MGIYKPCECLACVHVYPQYQGLMGEFLTPKNDIIECINYLSETQRDHPCKEVYSVETELAYRFKKKYRE